MKFLAAFDQARKSLGGENANQSALQDAVRYEGWGVAVTMITNAWRKLSVECVQNCRRATGILPAALTASTAVSAHASTGVTATAGSSILHDPSSELEEAMKRMQRVQPSVKFASVSQYVDVDDSLVSSCTV
jgi:hypothetical protein